MPRNLVKVTIAVGQTASTIAQGNGMTPVGIYIPANLTGTTVGFNAYNAAGNLEGSVTSSSGSALSTTIQNGASQYLPLSADTFGNGIDGLQIISGSTQATTAAVLTVVFR